MLELFLLNTPEASTLVKLLVVDDIVWEKHKITKHTNSKFKITSKQFPEDLAWSRAQKTTFKYSF